MKILSQKQLSLFSGKIDKEISDIFYNKTRCWEWTAAKTGKGYGQIKINGRMLSSHRIAYELAFGEIPTGLFVLHHCDNRSCCNPSHLFVGTNLENVNDKVGKKRQCARETHGGHKLTNEQVKEIRLRYKPRGVGGDSSYELSKFFGISRRQIMRILKNKSWKE